MKQIRLDGTDLVSESIRILKQYEPEDGYYLAFSGGKDSICCYWLCKLANVKFESHYHMTTIDPKGIPEFIRREYPDVIIEHPMYKGKRTNFYKLIETKGLPLRMRRWCCSILKEGGGTDRTVITGVREEESYRRQGREVYSEFKGKKILLPIYNWKSNDVWDFIKGNNYPYPSLYDEGKKRIGCVFCPLSCRESRKQDYYKYPERVNAIKKAYRKYWDTHMPAYFEKHKYDYHTKQLKDNPDDAVDNWILEGPIKSAKGKCLGDYLKEVE